MQQPDEHNELLDPTGPKREEIDTSAGYEQTDVRVTGIAVFLTALLVFVAVCGIVSYGLGKLINTHMNKEDGPDNKWTTTVNIRQLGNLPNNPEMQQKVAELTQQFPTPRVQLDDGNEDVAELHQKEDLLLDNYSWADRSKGTVRIPIERAMELIAQQGLPVASTAPQEPLLAGDSQPVVTVPLTNGFARTSYEQDLAAAKTAEEKQKQ